jgi:hypothetical protein
MAPNMKAAHKSLNIQPNEMMAVLENVTSTLTEQGVADREVADVLLLFWRRFSIALATSDNHDLPCICYQTLTLVIFRSSPYFIGQASRVT